MYTIFLSGYILLTHATGTDKKNCTMKGWGGVDRTDLRFELGVGFANCTVQFLSTFDTIYYLPWGSRGPISSG